MGRKPKEGATWQDARAGKLLRDLVEKKSTAQIAEEEGVTPRAIAYRMGREPFQAILSKFISDLTETSQDWIDELHCSSDPLDRRLAAQLKVQMLKIFTPRLSIADTRNISVKIEEQNIKVQRNWDNLPPEEQEKFDEMLLKLDRQS